MPVDKPIFSHIPVLYQEILIQGLINLKEPLNKQIDNYIAASRVKLDKQIINQVFLLNMLQNCFGLNFGYLYTSISSESSLIIRNFVQDSSQLFVSRSWGSKHSNMINSLNSTTLEYLSSQLQDYFFTTIGDTARERVKQQMHGVRQKITPPVECFFGLVPPSQIFPDLNTFERGKIIPFFNSMIYQHIHHISGIEEVVGNLKTAEFKDTGLYYRLAGRIGFIYRPPKLGEFYFFFAKLKPIFKTIKLEFNNYRIQ